MRGVTAKRLRRIAASVGGPKAYQLVEGRRVGTRAPGTKFQYWRLNPDSARAVYKQLKKAWKGTPLTGQYGEMK